MPPIRPRFQFRARTSETMVSHTFRWNLLCPVDKACEPLVAIAESEGQEAHANRGNCQQQQWRRHDRGRFVNFGVVGLRLSEERGEGESGHVERAERDTGERQHDEHRVPILENAQQHFVLGEEACQRYDPSERRGANCKRPACDGHPSNQTAHLAYVGLFVHGVHDAARAEKEHGLGRAVGHEVEQCATPTPPAPRDSIISPRWLTVE